MSAEIKSIRIKMGKREVELPISEARELKEALDELFGKEIVREVIGVARHPWYWERAIPMYQPTTPTWCASYDSNTSILNVQTSSYSGGK